ncbi:MAG: DUF2079 domain-containing protein [Actinomycetota bacterium]
MDEEAEACKPAEEPEPESVQTDDAAKRRSDRIFLGVVIAFICAYIVFFSTLCLLRYANFRASGLDTAIFSQAIWLMSRFRAPVSSIRGMNLYGDHMAPILVLLVPLYWLKGNAPALLVVQTVALGVAALPIYLLARDKLENRGVALALVIAYLMYPAVHFLNLFDFHPEALGLCFLLFAFLMADRRRFGWFYVFCGLAAFCKEDMVLAVIVLAILVYFLYDKRPGWIVAGAGAVYFMATVLFIIPAFAPAGYQYSGRLGQFGKTPVEAVKNMILHPLHTFSVLATRQNLAYVLELALPVAFLCFLAPVYLLPALPAFVINIISDFEPQHTIAFQYTAAIIPFVFIAAIFGIKRFKKWSDGAFRARKILGGIAAVMVLCAFASAVFFGPSPLAGGWRTKAYTSDAHIDTIRAALKDIPLDASVSAQVFLLAHLSTREKLYMFPNPFPDFVDREYYDDLGEGKSIVFPGVKRGAKVTPPEYVVLDRATSFSPLPDDGEQYGKVIDRILAGGRYETVFDDSGVLVLKRAP